MHASGYCVFLLDLPSHPMLLLCIFSYSKSSVGKAPPPAGTGQWGLTSQPSLHTGLKGVTSFLSHPQRQGKEASTPARNNERHLPRSHTTTPLKSCSWVEGSLWWPLHLSACPLQNSYPQSPQSVRWGLSASLSSCPTASEAGKLSLVWAWGTHVGLGATHLVWLYSKTSPGPPSWKHNPLFCHTPWLKMPTSGALPPRHSVTQKKGRATTHKNSPRLHFPKKCPLIPPVPSWPFIRSLTLVGLHQGLANLSCKGPNGKYFSLGRPHGLRCGYSRLSCWCENSHTQ